MDLFRKFEAEKIVALPGQGGFFQSTPHCFDTITMLSVWWNQSNIVFYDLFLLSKTAIAQSCRQQLINLDHALVENEWNEGEDLGK